MSSPTIYNPAPNAVRLPPRPRGLAFALSVVIILIYFGFILLVAYDKPLLGTELTPGLSWGILLGAVVIVVSWLLTLIYVVASNQQSARK